MGGGWVATPNPGGLGRDGGRVRLFNSVATKTFQVGANCLAVVRPSLFAPRRRSRMLGSPHPFDSQMDGLPPSIGIGNLHNQLKEAHRSTGYREVRDVVAFLYSP
jgi:hypothetical protein